MIRLMGFALMLLLASCSTAPTATTIAAADYGASPTGYQDKIRAALDVVLKDPSSAQLKFEEDPKQAWFHTQGMFAGELKGTVYGYSVVVQINAKNGYGGYVGFLPYKFFFHDGVLIAWRGESAQWQDLRR